MQDHFRDHSWRDNIDANNLYNVLNIKLFNNLIFCNKLHILNVTR